MSYKWPDKDKDEILDYSIDWSRFLGDDTISGVTWFIDDSDGTKTLIDAGEVVNSSTDGTENQYTHRSNNKIISWY